MKKLIHTPEGVRDIFGRECDKKRYLERQIEKLYRSYGYQSIETPAFEFFEVFASEVGTTPSKDLYKFFDRDGNTLALRPDFTPAVAQAVAMYFSNEEMPLRFCYHGNVYRNNHAYQGRLKESTQMGVEFLNDDSPEADAEIIALVVSTMRRSGLINFQVSIGHVDYFNALTAEAGMDEDTIAELRALLTIQNRFGAQELIDKLNMRSDLRKAFEELPELFGDTAVLERAKKLTTNETAKAAVERLQRIFEILKMHGCADYVTFDLGMVTEYSYYTGIIFQAYTYGSGDALIKGGRYNRLLEHFGKKAAAVGFATEIDPLLNAIERQRIQLPVKDIKTMVLYPVQMEQMAIRFAVDQRMRGLDVACVRFDPARVLDEYRAYGQRNQFGGIIYFRSESEVYAINLMTGQTETIDPFAGQSGNPMNSIGAVAGQSGKPMNSTGAVAGQNGNPVNNVENGGNR
ncbi:MAG: ATP phosphoribosyltransferase regulatory subunit [Eubacterium sp.]|nr:ATP phosphoribosyltransferase regulatory subunit [Eubacterium sp.]